MSRTALASYLLYRPDGTYATPAGISTTPADWELTPELQARITPATGCATFPEAPLNATGTPAKGATSFGRGDGRIDGHMHWMTFEYFGGRFHCGKPWDEFGIASRCRTARRSRARAAPRRCSRTSSTTATRLQPHDTRGYPY